MMMLVLRQLDANMILNNIGPYDENNIHHMQLHKQPFNRDEF